MPGACPSADWPPLLPLPAGRVVPLLSGTEPGATSGEGAGSAGWATQSALIAGKLRRPHPALQCVPMAGSLQLPLMLTW